MTEEKQSAAGERPEGCVFCELGSEFSRLFGGMYSDQSREHFRNSRIEFLKGLRSVIDARIDRLSQHGQKGTRVTVE